MTAYDAQKEDTAVTSVKKALKVLDSYLLEHTFLVGESVSLADIVGACNLYLGMTMVGFPLLASLRHLASAGACGMCDGRAISKLSVHNMPLRCLCFDMP